MLLEAEIENLIKARSEATVTGDLELLEQLLDERFSYVNRWGDVVNRNTYFVKKKESSPNNYWIAQTIDELEVIPITEEAAIARFRVLDHQVFEGEEMKDYVRTSYVCVRRDGNWRLLFGQTSPIEPE